MIPMKKNNTKELRRAQTTINNDFNFKFSDISGRIRIYERKQTEKSNPINKNNFIKTKTSENIKRILSIYEQNLNRDSLPLPLPRHNIVTPIVNNRSNTSISIDLDSSFMNLDNFLEAQPIPIEVENESFCEAFFIASFPTKGGSALDNSEGYLSTCEHELCSSLPGMEPQIIFRYPRKDKKCLELNNLAATICFPSGIKICYMDNDDVKTVKNYYSSITNQQGDRFYLSTYHFYKKMENIDFVKQYEVHPIKSQTMKFGDEYYKLMEKDKQIQEEVEKKVEIYGELNNVEFVYIPFCLCLISKYPYFHQMEKCLESIYIYISNEKSNTSEFSEIIQYIIKSISVPTTNTELRFSVPYISEFIDLICPNICDLCVISNYSFEILNLFSIDNIILLFRLILFEQKILFVDDEYDRLSKTINSFISLLYPLQ